MVTPKFVLVIFEDAMLCSETKILFLIEEDSKDSFLHEREMTERKRKDSRNVFIINRFFVG
jgi:hypothetical protein